MATTIITKNGSGAPLAGDLQVGELAIDLTNKKLYSKEGTTVFEVGATGGGAAGTFTDLTATNSFTSVGIDDNATSTAITIDASENVGIGTTNTSNARATIVSAGVNGADEIALAVDHGDLSLATNQEILMRFGQAGGSGSLAQIGATYTGGTFDGALLFKTNSSGTVTERMRIDSSGRVGINTSSPDSNIVSGIDNQSFVVARYDLSGGVPSGGLGGIYSANANAGGFSSGDVVIQARAGVNSRSVLFYTGNTSTERMRIDSSGNLLVGKTSTAFGTAGVEASASNGLWSTRSSLPPLALNRLSTDGSVVDFYKDGTAVGSIFSYNGFLGIGSPSGNDAYVLMGSDFVAPSTSTGAARDGAIDLGSSTRRFKDLYLSGGAYLGGTGSANHLDDYEEGTWTGTLRGLSGEPGTLVTTTGYYVKIGRAVHWTIGFENINTTGYSGAAEVDGLPFQNAYGRSVGSAINYITLSFGTDLVTKIESSATTIDLMDSRDSLAWASAVHNAGTGRYLWMTGTYQTNA